MNRIIAICGSLSVLMSGMSIVACYDAMQTMKEAPFFAMAIFLSLAVASAMATVHCVNVRAFSAN